MKTNMKATLAALALSAAALAATAQDNGMRPHGPGPGPRGHRPPPLPLAQALDANHDGVIDASEIANASAALLTLDKNGDGVLSTNEYLPPRPPDAPANAPRPPVSPLVKALDANGDGVIDASEIANAGTALKTLDANGDGELSRNEFCPPRPQGGGTADNLPPGPPPQDQ